MSKPEVYQSSGNSLAVSYILARRQPPSNVHDSKVLPELLHGNETRVWGDSAYVGQSAAMRTKAPNARGFINKRAFRNRPLSEADKETNRRKSSVRAHVEHRFGIIKGLFGFRTVRYRGLA